MAPHQVRSAVVRNHRRLYRHIPAVRRLNVNVRRPGGHFGRFRIRRRREGGEIRRHGVFSGLQPRIRRRTLQLQDARYGEFQRRRRGLAVGHGRIAVMTGGMRITVLCPSFLQAWEIGFRRALPLACVRICHAELRFFEDFC